MRRRQQILESAIALFAQRGGGQCVRDRFRLLRQTLTARIESGQRAGRIAADIDPLDAAALVIAASDGLQIQWLLDPGQVDVGRSLSILERLLPRDPEPGGASVGPPAPFARGRPPLLYRDRS